MSKKLLFPILSCLILIFSCKTDPPATNQADLEGRWELTKAFRNGKATETLTHAFFEFDETGNMKTNFTGSEQASTYELNDKKIKEKGGNDLTYNIEKLDKDNLTLEFNMQNFDFKLELRKAQVLKEDVVQ